MADVQWNAEASLMRVTPIVTADDQQEELLARGTVYELVGMALELPVEQQRGLLLRQAGADDVAEYDAGEIRELAALPEFTSAHGSFDTEDYDDAEAVSEAEDEETLVDGETSGPSHTDAAGRDGER